MSLVIDLIGQTVMLLAVRLVNCHVIGCKTRKNECTEISNKGWPQSKNKPTFIFTL